MKNNDTMRSALGMGFAMLTVLLTGCGAGTESHIPAMTNNGQNPSGGFRPNCPRAMAMKVSGPAGTVLDRDAALAELAAGISQAPGGAEFAAAAAAAFRSHPAVAASGTDTGTGSAWGRFTDGRLVIAAAAGAPAATLELGRPCPTDLVVEVSGAAGCAQALREDGTTAQTYAVATRTTRDAIRDAEFGRELDTNALVYVIVPGEPVVYGVTAAQLGACLQVSAGGVVVVNAPGSDSFAAFAFKKAALDAGASVHAGWSGAVDGEVASRLASHLRSVAGATAAVDWAPVVRDLAALGLDRGTGPLAESTVSLTSNLKRRPRGL